MRAKTRLCSFIAPCLSRSVFLSAFSWEPSQTPIKLDNYTPTSLTWKWKNTFFCKGWSDSLPMSFIVFHWTVFHSM